MKKLLLIVPGLGLILACIWNERGEFDFGPLNLLVVYLFLVYQLYGFVFLIYLIISLL
jgi:hypothetical protein